MDVILEELKIHRFRNVPAGTVLKLGYPFTVLLGKNATGKTTLLSLISAVLQSYYPFSSEDIRLEYKFKTPQGTIEGEVLSEPLLELKPMMTGSGFRMIGLPRGYQQYENIKLIDRQGNYCDLTYEPSQGQYQFQSSSFPKESMKTSGGTRKHAYWAASEAFAKEDIFLEMLGQTIVSAATRFDESLEHFARMTAVYQPSVGDSLSPFFQAILTENGSIRELSASEALPLSLGDFSLVSKKLEMLFQDAVNNNKSISEIRFDCQELEWLHTFAEHANFANVMLRFEMIQRNRGETDALLFGNPSFEFFKKDGSSIIHSLLSYGQKRLLSFVCYLADNRDFVVADELVNGLHHEWINFCMDELSQRQSFLASQNPLLIDYLYFSSVEEVLPSFILCTTDTTDGKEHICWKQMSQEEAQDFFKSYQTGFQYVSEILKNKGLW